MSAPSIAKDLVEKAQRWITDAIDHVERSEPLSYGQLDVRVAKRLPPRPTRLIGEPPDMGSNEIFAPRFVSGEEGLPFSRVPDIELNEPIVVVRRVGQIKVEDRRMSMPRQTIFVNHLIRQLRESGQVEHMAARIPGEKFLKLRGPEIQQKPCVRGV